MAETEEKPGWLESIVERIPNWDTLIAMSRNRIVNSSYLFLFVTPIAAKVTQHLPDVVEVPVGSGYQFAIALPFSWLWLFWCALAASAGTVLVLVQCPVIISRYKDFSEFEQAAGSQQHLKKIAQKLRCDSYPFTEPEKHYGPLNVSELRRMRLASGDPQVMAVQKKVNGINFNALRNFANVCCFRTRAVISVLYLIAVSCFCWIVFRNICFVVRFMFS